MTSLFTQCSVHSVKNTHTHIMEGYTFMSVCMGVYLCVYMCTLLYLCVCTGGGVGEEEINRISMIEM